jgi:2-phosphoglycerate kinase
LKKSKKKIHKNMQSPIQPPWRVLLLGGNAGVGKTRVSRALAHQWGVSVLLADDIRMALQVTTSAQQLDLYFFMTDPAIWQRTPEELCEGWIGVAKVVSSALKKASHLYGQWLQREAQAHNAPVLPAHPWETLHQRIIETINPH